jgi:galactokinase
MGDRRVRALAEALGGGGDLRVTRAPGRVNLMGDHTDYNAGLVLPLALDRDCLVAARRRRDGRVHARSLELDGEVDVAADGSDDPGSVEPPWGRFVAGVVRVLVERRWIAGGADLALSSTVPPGSGLSSSAALEVALALALAPGGALPRRELAQACRWAEHLATGVPSGVMDQLAALFGRAGHALLIDCRTLEVEYVSLPARLAVLVVHSGVPRTLAESAYADRRAACAAAADRIGVRELRDADPQQVAGDRRARHVVSENRRVLDTASALHRGDAEALRPLLLASHASLRDDFEVSTPELDLLVDLLVESGAVGARLTGAGFGGCVVALVQRNHADDVAAKTVRRYRDATGREPSAFVARAVDGAGTVVVP